MNDRGVIATPLVADHDSDIRQLGKAAQFPRARQICGKDEEEQEIAPALVRQHPCAARGSGTAYLAGGVILGACWRARAMLVIAVSAIAAVPISAAVV